VGEIRYFIIQTLEQVFHLNFFKDFQFYGFDDVDKPKIPADKIFSTLHEV